MAVEFCWKLFFYIYWNYHIVFNPSIFIWCITLLGFYIEEPLHPWYISHLIMVQFSFVAQSCPTLCNPMNRGTPGLPVHHQLLEFTHGIWSFLLCCWILLLFCWGLLSLCSSVILACNFIFMLFLLFWYQGDGSLIEWIWESSSLCKFW